LKTIHRIEDLVYEPGISVGFVPTMGAFHEGHLSLMRTAKQENDVCVVSLFVNPTQFGPKEDFSRYPRDLERDRRLAGEAGADILFAPDVATMYPDGFATKISVSGVTERWEGALRPGHFDGVATVVNRLFGIVRPHCAYFGLKDLQQCRVIDRMVRDLNMPVALMFLETYREQDGLAMSSRNVYLTPEERKIAPLLFETLRVSRQAVRDGYPVDQVLDQARSRLRDAGFLVDYFEHVLLDDLRPIDHLERPTALIVAAKLGIPRLLDNIVI